jgi:cysteine sulfinate desulfinase/cysteine desulfurase-like protein
LLDPVVAGVDPAAITWLELSGGTASENDVRRAAASTAVILGVVNHELGTFSGDAVLSCGQWQLLDATAAVPWIRPAAFGRPTSLVAFSGSKLGAPQGIGVLRVPAQLRVRVGDEFDADTVSTVGIVGLGAAAALWREQGPAWRASVGSTCAELLAGFERLDPGVRLNGLRSARQGTLVNVSFTGARGAQVAANLGMRGICIAHTSACRAASDARSQVVAAAYPGDALRAEGATRWSPGPSTTRGDVEQALMGLEQVLDVTGGFEKPPQP